MRRRPAVDRWRRFHDEHDQNSSVNSSGHVSDQAKCCCAAPCSACQRCRPVETAHVADQANLLRQGCPTARVLSWARDRRRPVRPCRRDRPPCLERNPLPATVLVCLACPKSIDAVRVGPRSLSANARWQTCPSSWPCAEIIRRFQCRTHWC